MHAGSDRSGSGHAVSKRPRPEKTTALSGGPVWRGGISDQQATGKDVWAPGQPASGKGFVLLQPCWGPRLRGGPVLEWLISDQRAIGKDVRSASKWHRSPWPIKT